MCEQGDTREVRVKVLAGQSRDGKERWELKPIDLCISNIVEALQKGGINMRGSCCGHGKRHGNIVLEDGRGILIWETEEVMQEHSEYEAAANSLSGEGA